MKKIILTVLLIVAGLTTSLAQLIITVPPAGNYSSIQSALFPAGITSVSPTFRGDASSIATFVSGATNNIGFNDGVFLSTGHTSSAANPQSSQQDFDMAIEGDTDLQYLTGAVVRDVAVFEFDITLKSDSLKFRFVFASEEYPEFTCAPFVDVMGIFLTGPKPGGGFYNKENITHIPQTSIPVGINSINAGSPGANAGANNCTNVNESLNYSSYYVNNTGGTNIIFDGFTIPILVNVPVYACETYHIKIAIADVSDGLFDSGLFIESFTPGGFPHVIGHAGISQSFNDTTLLCTGDTVNLSPSVQALNYNWSGSGGATTTSITVNTPGNFSYFIFNPQNGCTLPSYAYHVIADPNCVVSTYENLSDAFTISPNPFTNQIHVTLNSGESTTYSITDLNGKLILNGVLNNKESIIDFSNRNDVDAGVYILRITQEGKSTQQKIVYQKS
ncbi:MAG: choice-of-anchor L domain-containing protein [Bacteroidota bacterium]